MNLGLRSLLLLVAVVVFVLAIFMEENWDDLVAIGLACFAGSYLVAGAGFDRPLGRRR